MQGDSVIRRAAALEKPRHKRRGIVRTELRGVGWRNRLGQAQQDKFILRNLLCVTTGARGVKSERPNVALCR